MSIEKSKLPDSPAEFHLLADRVGAPTAGVPQQPLAAVLPEQPAQLRVDANHSPTAMVLDESAAPVGPIVQPLWSAQPPRLLFLAEGHDAVRVNGVPAPRVTLLREGDHVQWNEEVAFQVAIFRRPRIGAPEAGQIGKPCPVCTLPVAESTRVYVCAHCGTAMHCEEIEGGFECARLRSECTCGRPINFHAGYAQLPNWI